MLYEYGGIEIGICIQIKIKCTQILKTEKPFYETKR